MTNWTAHLSYTAPDLDARALAAITEHFGEKNVEFDDGKLSITVEVDAPTLRQATDEAQRAATAGCPRVKPDRFGILTTADYQHSLAHPGPMALVGIAEIGAQYGLQRTRASKLAKRAEFPDPVAELAATNVYTQASVDIFHAQWLREKELNPRGGRPRKAPPAEVDPT